MSRDPIKQQLAKRRHYEKNKAVIKVRARERTTRVRNDVRAWLRAYLKDHHCVDCGEDNPIVLEFDHTDPKHKQFNIGDATKRGFSLRRVQDEVAKCEVRCANCHRKKTYRDAGHTHRG